MKTRLLLGAIFMLSHSFSQTTVYSENFNTGSTWTLNTVTGAEGTYPNAWYISCQEDGQVPGQCGTACSINDNSLHVSWNPAFGDAGATYLEGAGCTTSKRAESANISTVGASNLTLSFDMIGAGNAQDYTELFYSINGGVSWTSLATPLTSLCCGGVACTGSEQGLWKNNTYTLPATCNGINNLRIAFVWKNSDDGSATDPSFAVDDILITMPAASNTISTTNDASPASWCFNATPSGTVNFTSSGTFTAGNIYTAQLSDASGSFAAPISIGTLNSTASGALSIATSIPSGIAVGTGYRIRVVSSSPVTTGTDNTANLIINALPSVTMGALSDVCVYNASFALTQGSPASGLYSGTGVSAGMFNPSTAGLGAHTITYTYADGNNCLNTANTVINVNGCASIEELDAADIIIVPNPVETSFQIVGIDAESKVELVDFSGKVISTFDKGESTFDVSNLSKGIYIVRITKGSDSMLTKLIKQ